MGERIEGGVGWEGLRGWGWGFVDMGLVWILENFRAYDLYLKSFLFSFFVLFSYNINFIFINTINY